MSFLHPILFAAGLVSIGIPIAIHLLLRQRRRPVMWGAMRFLIEAYRRQRRRLRVEQWLLLAARCLVVLLIGAALARPVLEGAGLLSGAPGRTVYILLDTGLASSAREGASAEETALDRHKKTAMDLLSTLGASDRAGLVLLGAPASAVVAPASGDVAAVRRLIEEASPTDAATDLAGAFERIARVLDQDEASGARPTTLVLLSDFYLGSADAARPLPLSLAARSNVRLLVSKPRGAGEAASNVQVTGVEPLRPLILTGAAGASGAGAAEREQVRVTLRRSGPAVGDSSATTVRLRAMGGSQVESPPSQGLVRWQPGQVEAMVAVPVSAAGGARDSATGMVLVAEIDRDALPGDNVFRRPIGVRESLRVGVVARARFGADTSLDRLGPADWLRLALRPTPGTPIDVVDIEPTSIDTPTLASVDVVFAPAPDLIRDEDWARLRRFVDAGGMLVVSPAAEATVHLWTDAMTRELGLPWRLAREPVQYPEGMGVDDQSVSTALLSLIASELPSLVRPVVVSRAVPPEGVGPETEVLLSLKDGSAWVIASSPGAGRVEGSGEGAGGESGQSHGLVVYFASAPTLKWTDLPAKPLMVPLIQELSRQGFGRASGSWWSKAGVPAAAPFRSEQLRPVAASGSESGGEMVAVAPTGLTTEPMRKAGLWQSFDEGGRARGFVAVNADSDAGRTIPQDPSVIRGWLSAALGTGGGGAGAGERLAWLEESDAAPVLAASSADSPFSVPMLLVVLVLAVAELVMARYFSHAFAR
ncbi:MAG: BatA domain-containing protein [Phycisphaerae bacterium]|nr:BatA domain-containing protein [Phycisphaerae bacterium]